jgi:hypothetical protein
VPAGAECQQRAPWICGRKTKFREEGNIPKIIIIFKKTYSFILNTVGQSIEIFLKGVNVSL